MTIMLTDDDHSDGKQHDVESTATSGKSDSLSDTGLQRTLTSSGWYSDSWISRRQNGSSSKMTGGRFTVKMEHSVTRETLEARQTVLNRLKLCMESMSWQLFSASLIFATVILICMDVNSRAKGRKTSVWEDVAMTFCFAAYVLEVLATIAVQGKRSIWDAWNYVDAVVIITGIVDYIMSAYQSDNGLQLLRLLRCCRLLRLGRLARAMKKLQRTGWFKEQYVLCMMMASCVRTLLWAFLLCFFVMTLWSILAVETLNDAVKDLAAGNPELWLDCNRCKRSFSSVWDANWTFFQTIVAGDSWGQVALPLIEKHSWAAPILVGALCTIVFGTLNMITAVVIDTFAENRSKDIMEKALDIEYEEGVQKRELEKMFQKIDADHSGALSLQELQSGWMRVKEFRQYLRVLDIDDNDLCELFDMIDCDRSGEVDPCEFIEALYRMRHTEPKTAARFVKHMVTNMFDKQKTADERLDVIQESVLKRLESVENRVLADLETTASKNEVAELLAGYSENLDDALSKAVERAAAVALDAAMDSAISKASQAIRQVVVATSNRHAAINARVNQFCANGDSLSRQVSSQSQDVPPFIKQISPQSCESQLSNHAVPNYAATPQPQETKGIRLLAQHVGRPASEGAMHIQLGVATRSL